MKILLLNWLDRENPRAGGAEIHLHEMFGRLVRRGWRVSLITSGWPGAAARTVLDGIEVHRVGGRHTYALVAAPYIRMNFQNERFDLAIEDLNKIPLFLPFWSPAPPLLLVHHLFGRAAFEAAPFPIAAASWLLEKAIPSVYRNLPVVAVSTSTREDLRVRGMSQDRIEVIENGVDPVYFSPGEEAERYPRPTLLYLGRLRRYKRVDLILKAVAVLKGQGVRTQLLVAGKGDEEERLKHEALTLNLSEEDIRFLGYVSEEEKVELLQRAWVHILTSPKEGWGISIVEAAACGTPTVASDAPGLRDSVRHGETGFLVGHGDVEALAARIQILVEDSDLRRRMGFAAREFSEGLSWDRSSDRLAEVLAREASR